MNLENLEPSRRSTGINAIIDGPATLKEYVTIDIDDDFSPNLIAQFLRRASNEEAGDRASFFCSLHRSGHRSRRMNVCKRTSALRPKKSNHGQVALLWF